MNAKEENEGETVRVCHKKARIVDSFKDSYRAEIKLGGIIQYISLTPEYVHERLEGGA